MTDEPHRVNLEQVIKEKLPDLIDGQIVDVYGDVKAMLVPALGGFHVIQGDQMVQIDHEAFGELYALMTALLRYGATG